MNEVTLKIRTVIADDEHLARKKLRLLLQEEGCIQIVAECKNVKEAQQALQIYKPDLLLLDIEMPDGNGFDVLKNVQLCDGPIVIFTTAYDQYAIQAFASHALDYLLKPFDHERLHASIERARLEWVRSKNDVLSSRLLECFHAQALTDGSDRRLIIKTGGRVIFLDSANIHWIESEANYIRIHLAKESYLLRETISRMTGKLDATQFVRIHRSLIVNIKRIKELVPCNSGEFVVILKDGKELSCSRGYRGAIHSLLTDAAK